jgi:hypothetical protein
MTPPGPAELEAQAELARMTWAAYDEAYAPKGVRMRSTRALPRPKRARGTRRVGCGGRPRTRRTTSSATSRGDPALADEPPGHRPPSREGAA